MFSFDPEMFRNMFQGFDPNKIALNTTLNALTNLDMLYIDVERNENGIGGPLIKLVGYKNGKATYTSTITLRVET